jgi:hypothetical protein
MRTTIEMAREAAGDDWGLFQEYMTEIHRLVELVRADERSSWPAEMEAMERQVNILTDALADEREACAKVCDAIHAEHEAKNVFSSYADAIRARSNT